MNIATYKQLAPYLMKSRIVPLVWGKHGLGKTEVHQQIAQELNYNFIYLTFGAVEDVGDIIGLPNPNSDGTTSHLRPDWFPTTPGNIMLIDEFNRANKAILQAMYPLILSGKLHTHQLPEDTHIFLAANPPTEDYITTDISDYALMSRVCHLVLRPSHEEWAEYNRATGALDPSVVNFFSANPEFLDFSTDGFSIEDVRSQKVDPRSASMFGRFRKHCDEKHLLQEVGFGILGATTTAKYFAWFDKYGRYIKGQDVLDGLSVDDQTYFKELVKEERIDSLNNTCEELRALLANPEITYQQSMNFIQFILQLPKELAIKLIIDVLKTENKTIDQVLCDNKDVIQFFKHHKEAIEALTNVVSE